jgi:Tfp pilus assembly protein PilN
MYDYNFFESYKTKKKTNKSGTGLITATVLLAFVLLAGLTAYTYYQNALILADNIVMSTELALTENVDIFNRIEAKQNLNTQLMDMSTNLTQASTLIEQREVIRMDLMDTLVLALPSDAQILNLSLSDTTISLSGVAAQRSAIAEFEKSLRDTARFERIAISSITTQEEDFSFDMSLMLGGVSNENNQ